MLRVALFENKDQVTCSKLDWCLHPGLGGVLPRIPGSRWKLVGCVWVCMGGGSLIDAQVCHSKSPR